jgi:hypothetical protein
MRMSGLKRGWLVAMLLVLAACGSAGKAASGVTEEDSWRSSSSSDGMLTVGAPGAWVLTDDAGSGVALATPDGGTFAAEYSEAGGKGSRTQPQILEGMLADATAEFGARSETIEEVGRRVWMGENYIWHEIQYVANPTGECSGCRPAFYVDFLAYPDSGGAVSGRFTSAGAQPLDDEAAANLTKVIDSISVRTPGTT